MKVGIKAKTQLRLPTAEILRLNSELTTVQQELDAFSYSVSHDLRAPLRHILGHAEILQATAGPKVDATSRRQLQTITESATRMWEMIDALLELSRMGRISMRCQSVNLAVLVAEVRRDLSRETRGRAIDWRVGALPVVQGDPSLLRQVIVQLLNNAIKFTRPHSRAKIEIMAETSARETICSVRDNGVGFDMIAAPKLFGAFQQYHRAGEFPGIGVGLALVRRIIHRHGGQAWAEASVGSGATFYFSIPSHQEQSLELC